MFSRGIILTTSSPAAYWELELVAHKLKRQPTGLVGTRAMNCLCPFASEEAFGLILPLRHLYSYSIPVVFKKKKKKGKSLIIALFYSNYIMVL